jgi:tryptophan 2,3-dioxygenase
LEFRDRLNPASGFQSLQFRELEFLVGVKEERYLTHFQNRPEMIAALKRRLAETDLRQSYYALLEKLGFEIPAGTYRIESTLQSGLPREGMDSAELDAVRQGVMRVFLPIYRDPEKYLPLYLLTESLVDLDQYLAIWRDHHVRVVERVIGFKPGTGGSSGVGYLRMTTAKKAFPFLWEARGFLER